MVRIAELTDKVRRYNARADINVINRAFVFASLAHNGQQRKDGDPYISHPLAVADILADLKADESSLVAALLHDTVEDTHATLDEVTRRFGTSVARLVDGMTKLNQIRFNNAEEKRAENLRKMILATSEDVRVLLVKLADRLHNMRTLDAMSPAKRLEISQETMNLYVPLAHRLGMHRIKQELEDLAFCHLDPDGWREIEMRLAIGKEERLDRMRRDAQVVEAEVHKQFGPDKPISVQGRMKNHYSLHQKMTIKHVSFEDIYDLMAFRVVVPDISDCYQALGIIHSLYRPVPGRFKDYIALPKPNGYQSLHTTIIGPGNQRIEVQIRTEKIHQAAENGVAAHWLYKDGQQSSTTASQRFDHDEDRHFFQWLRRLIEMIDQSENSNELLENVRLELFVHEVYVFDRDGKLHTLPRGATPLDFAYSLHSALGHHFAGVRINGEPGEIDARLRNGDKVEVFTNPDQSPGRDWEKFVVTPRAKQHLRQWFNRQKREELEQMGSEIITAIFGRDRDLDATILKALGCATLDELKQRLALGKISAERLLEATRKEQRRWRTLFGRELQPPQKRAACCNPLPGDHLVGLRDTSGFLVVHCEECPQSRHRRKNDHWIDSVDWQIKAEQSLYPVPISIRAENRHGMLAEISTAIANCEVNISFTNLSRLAGSMITLSFGLDVPDRIQLAKVMRAVRKISGVAKVERVVGDKPVQLPEHEAPHETTLAATAFQRLKRILPGRKTAQ